jgi:hypothetical protein
LLNPLERHPDAAAQARLHACEGAAIDETMAFEGAAEGLEHGSFFPNERCSSIRANARKTAISVTY